MSKEESITPFGINQTRRYVSDGGEEVLYDIYHVGSSGEVELVDYMGGDETVERVATSGHGRSIFKEEISKNSFLNFLVAHGIYEPFKSVQLKFSIQSPIEVALSLVYEPSANVNEYSGRYSQMLQTAEPPIMKLPPWIETKSEKAQEIARRAVQLRNRNRENAYNNYRELVCPELDMARELARSGLGIDNDTRFYWKMDLFSLAQFVKKQNRKTHIVSRTGEYIKIIEDLAFMVAPTSWRALINDGNDDLYSLTMPKDKEVVDGPLSPPSWKFGETKRVTVPDLEKRLFEIETFLDHGEFQVVDYMGDDSSLAQAARTSYGQGTKTIQDDKNLIVSLKRDHHTTPIEMAELAFESKSPLFSDPRQLARHRTLDNHGFMGYHPLGNQYYHIPDREFKYQDRVNRQGRGKEMSQEDREKVKGLLLKKTFEYELETVKNLEEINSPEWIIRGAKGVGFYTKMWRTGDPHNISHLLKLRLESHAQMEVSVLAEKIAHAHELHTPIAYQAHLDYVINAMQLSTKEIKLLRENSLIRSDIDLENLDNYKGVGFVIPVDKDDPSKGKKLSREGMAFKEKLIRLLK